MLDIFKFVYLSRAWIPLSQHHARDTHSFARFGWNFLHLADTYKPLTRISVRLQRPCLPQRRSDISRFHPPFALTPSFARLKFVLSPFSPTLSSPNLFHYLLFFAHFLLYIFGKCKFIFYIYIYSNLTLSRGSQETRPRNLSYRYLYVFKHRQLPFSIRSFIIFCSFVLSFFFSFILSENIRKLTIYVRKWNWHSYKIIEIVSQRVNNCTNATRPNVHTLLIHIYPSFLPVSFFSFIPFLLSILALFTSCSRGSLCFVTIPDPAVSFLLLRSTTPLPVLRFAPSTALAHAFSPSADHVPFFHPRRSFHFTTKLEYFILHR